jgi:hypothetical protein
VKQRLSAALLRHVERAYYNRAMARKSGLTASCAIATPPEIRALVEKFANHGETYHRAGYKETQSRQDFLDPFLSALGWKRESVQYCTSVSKTVILSYHLVSADTKRK